MLKALVVAGVVAQCSGFSLAPRAGVARTHQRSALTLRMKGGASPERREALGAVLGAGAAIAGAMSKPETASAGAAYTLPPLPFGYGELEPHIDEMTMKIHHDKHHQAYVNNVNKALEGKEIPSLVDLQKGAMSSDVIRNNGGGHYNHAFFWTTLTPAAKSGAPSAALANAIDSSFGGMDKMMDEFSGAAAKRFGSGWAWLGVAPDGKLVIDSTPNQDNPLMDGAGTKQMIPILGLDVWEHAYYLKYQNKRPEYIEAFFNVVNWGQVSKYYEEYASKGMPVPIQG
eukprot:CAMPEP_0206230420 /NCGR_PEP_ID=MMETSP0047_2-20121206/10252_1 /ASSEMBLY_ACC=CAM_ASM_000192 /TAXON_ID=195065 /ORGANISM="Chroomonas mesostigmatica_cf, Strain CCMP1168" /LENGTH=284 /DNA_ID=CAMNT_0053653847 /DNA_START=8 /DNA_END=862 /DNA_ORIENTATION=+